MGKRKMTTSSRGSNNQKKAHTSALSADTVADSDDSELDGQGVNSRSSVVTTGTSSLKRPTSSFPVIDGFEPIDLSQEDVPLKADMVKNGKLFLLRVPSDFDPSFLDEVDFAKTNVNSIELDGDTYDVHVDDAKTKPQPDFSSIDLLVSNNKSGLSVIDPDLIQHHVTVVRTIGINPVEAPVSQEPAGNPHSVQTPSIKKAKKDPKSPKTGKKKKKDKTKKKKKKE